METIREQAADSARQVLSVEEFCRQYGIGKDRAFKEIRAGRLRAKKMGRRTLIPVTDAARWLEALPDRPVKNLQAA